MSSSSILGVPPNLDPLYFAQFKFRRRCYDECISICTSMLSQNPFDQAVWLLKTRALIARGYLDDVDWDDASGGGIAEILLDDNAVAQAPRPGTSLMRPSTSMNVGGGGSTAAQAAARALDSAMRPMTASGRPMTGYARPGTSAAPSSSSFDSAFKAGRPGTSRVMTAMGRAVRVGTASLLSAPGGPFIVADKLDLRKYASRPALGKALCDYLLYVDHNPKRAMELCALGTISAGYSDWWWKERLGKTYFQLGLLRDAEAQFKSSLRQQEMVSTHLQLARVCLRLDQPQAALEVYRHASEGFAPNEPALLLGAARVHDALSQTEAASTLYRKVLELDASNVEALACLASHSFYQDQPEVSLRYYRRILQLGVQSAELWNNLGLATFHASQYDLSLSCFDRAIQIAEDDAVGDVWYNVANVAVSLGDIAMAKHALRVAIAADPQHAEAHVNLGVLEMRRGSPEVARGLFASAQRLAGFLFEAWFNGALAAYKAGDLQDSYQQCKRALELSPTHSDAIELSAKLKEVFLVA
jgi:tetratricopeptide repeat protein 8